MARHTARVDYYTRNSDGSYPSTPTLSIPQVLAINANYNLNATGDAINVTLHDYDGTMSKTISPYDLVRVYGNIGGSDVIVMDALIQNKGVDDNARGRVITLSCMNRLEKLFNGLIYISGNVSRTADAWIQYMLTQINALNPNQTITWDSGNSTITSDGAITYKVGYIPGWQLLRDMSQPANTIQASSPNGDYYDYYLDTNNHLIWKKRGTTTLGTFTYGTDLQSFHSEQGVFNIINYVLLNCGKDPAGYSILALGYNDKSIQDNGWKMKVVAQMGIATGMKITERQANPGKFDSTVTTNDYPTSYPYTTTWGVTCNSNSDYLTAFRAQAKTIGQKTIDQILRVNYGQVFKNNIAINPNLGLLPSNTYYISNNAMSNEYNNTYYRIKTIFYNYDVRGWNVSLQIDQDQSLIL